MGFDRNMYQAISQFFLKISQLLFFSDHHIGMDFKKYFIRFGMTAVSEAAASIFPENMVHATILLNTVLKKITFSFQICPNSPKHQLQSLIYVLIASKNYIFNILKQKCRK